MSLLSVEQLSVAYGRTTALRAASLQLAAGEILAVVGESGSGKSSLARAVAGLVKPHSGRITLDGSDLALRPRVERRAIQMVFQDPDASLNPRHTVRFILDEPLQILAYGPAAARAERIETLLRLVQLEPALLDRRPIALSGGQKQRVAIARALAMQPRVLLADEALSALDMSTQSTLLDLFASLRRETGIAILFISHDLAAVRRLADRVCVLYRGRVVEQGDCAQVLAAPQHPYTKLLVAATIDPARALQDPAFLARLADGVSVEEETMQ
ncbi:MAG: dipeptide/oligopeptide transporter ATP-binding subunit [Rhodospirillales bacterium]|nr:dipeptide/oligopeptide transporter ATP-binding subunit [Rhodospirillales bacterium]